MNLHAYLRLIEAEQHDDEAVPFIKAWLHAATGRHVEMSFYDKHSEVARLNRRLMGITGSLQDANVQMVEKGWVRISSSKEGAIRAVHGYVTARNAMEARTVLRWMRDDEQCLPPCMDIELYQGGQSVAFFTLVDDDLHRFIDRGVKPRPGSSAIPEERYPRTTPVPGSATPSRRTRSA